MDPFLQDRFESPPTLSSTHHRSPKSAASANPQQQQHHQLSPPSLGSSTTATNGATTSSLLHPATSPSLDSNMTDSLFQATPNSTATLGASSNPPPLPPSQQQQQQQGVGTGVGANGTALLHHSPAAPCPSSAVSSLTSSLSSSSSSSMSYSTFSWPQMQAGTPVQGRPNTECGMPPHQQPSHHHHQHQQQQQQMMSSWQAGAGSSPSSSSYYGYPYNHDSASHGAGEGEGRDGGGVPGSQWAEPQPDQPPSYLPGDPHHQQASHLPLPTQQAAHAEPYSSYYLSALQQQPHHHHPVQQPLDGQHPLSHPHSQVSSYPQHQQQQQQPHSGYFHHHHQNQQQLQHHPQQQQQQQQQQQLSPHLHQQQHHNQHHHQQHPEQQQPQQQQQQILHASFLERFQRRYREPSPQQPAYPNQHSQPPFGSPGGGGGGGGAMAQAYAGGPLNGNNNNAGGLGNGVGGVGGGVVELPPASCGPLLPNYDWRYVDCFGKIYPGEPDSPALGWSRYANQGPVVVTHGFNQRILAPRPGPAIELANHALWRTFNSQTCEMIITKSGRRIFPTLNVRLTGLNPKKVYNLYVDMVLADPSHLKYTNGQWQPSGQADSNAQAIRPPAGRLPRVGIKNSMELGVTSNGYITGLGLKDCGYGRVFVHPDSPNTGAFWMKGEVCFAKLKLTNNRADTRGHVIVSSMHKYQPRVHVMALRDNEAGVDEVAVSAIYPETQFIAVTAYQNTEITNLKIKNNPFAKGFRDSTLERNVFNGLLPQNVVVGPRMMPLPPGYPPYAHPHPLGVQPYPEVPGQQGPCLVPYGPRGAQHQQPSASAAGHNGRSMEVEGEAPAGHQRLPSASPQSSSASSALKGAGDSASPSPSTSTGKKATGGKKRTNSASYARRKKSRDAGDPAAALSSHNLSSLARSQSEDGEEPMAVNGSQAPSTHGSNPSPTQALNSPTNDAGSSATATVPKTEHAADAFAGSSNPPNGCLAGGHARPQAGFGSQEPQAQSRHPPAAANGFHDDGLSPQGGSHVGRALMQALDTPAPQAYEDARQSLLYLHAGVSPPGPSGSSAFSSASPSAAAASLSSQPRPVPSGNHFLHHHPHLPHHQPGDAGHHDMAPLAASTAADVKPYMGMADSCSNGSHHHHLHQQQQQHPLPPPSNEWLMAGSVSAPSAYNGGPLGPQPAPSMAGQGSSLTSYPATSGRVTKGSLATATEASVCGGLQAGNDAGGESGVGLGLVPLQGLELNETALAEFLDHVASPFIPHVAHRLTASNNNNDDDDKNNDDPEENYSGSHLHPLHHQLHLVPTPDVILDMSRRDVDSLAVSPTSSVSAPGVGGYSPSDGLGMCPGGLPLLSVYPYPSAHLHANPAVREGPYHPGQLHPHQHQYPFADYVQQATGADFTTLRRTSVDDLATMERMASEDVSPLHTMPSDEFTSLHRMSSDDVTAAHGMSSDDFTTLHNRISSDDDTTVTMMSSEDLRGLKRMSSGDLALVKRMSAEDPKNVDRRDGGSPGQLSPSNTLVGKQCGVGQVLLDSMVPASPKTSPADNNSPNSNKVSMDSGFHDNQTACLVG